MDQGLIARNDAIAACLERKEGKINGRRSQLAQRTARSIADRIRAVPASSKPLGEQVRTLTASLEAKVAENATLARKNDELRAEIEGLKKIVAAA